jgi:hypothetical protein
MHADPHWLRTVRFGVELRILAIVGFLGSLLISQVRYFDFRHRLLALAGVSMIATLLLTSSEPVDVSGEPGTRTRHAARFSSMVAIAFAAILCSTSISPFPTLSFLWLSVVVDIAYLRHLAERIPDERLAAASQSVGWGLGACGVCIALSSVVLEIVGIAGASPSTLGASLGWLLCFVFVALPAAGLISFTLLCVYAGVLREQIKIGARNRSTEP